MTDVYDDAAVRAAAADVAGVDPRELEYEREERAAINGYVAPSAPNLPRFSWCPTSAIFAPLPETVWRVPGLQLCAGRPSMLAAYGATGKTIVMQALLLAAAAGRPIWGEFRVPTPLRVGHVDHEQGQHATRKRYHRLRHGHGYHFDELGGRLSLVCFPPVYLNSPRAEDVYARECEQLDIVLLDALRGATPGVDENDSKIRECIDRLTRVSEKVGTTFVILHQAPKPKDKDYDRRTVARGSSAIFDGCGAVFVMTGTKDAPRLVTQEKAPAEADGSLTEKFYLAVEDVRDDETGNPRAGVRVTFRTQEQAAPEVGPRAKLGQLKDRVVRLVAESPDCSLRFLRGTIKGSKDLFDEAVEQLVAERRLTNLGTPKAAKYRVSQPPPKGSNDHTPSLPP